MLARRSHELLDGHRRGEPMPESCPLQSALKSGSIPAGLRLGLSFVRISSEDAHYRCVTSADGAQNHQAERQRWNRVDLKELKQRVREANDK